MPCAPFQVHRDGIPIWQYPLSDGVPTGIEFLTDIDEIVSDFEAREAAVYCNYSPAEFAELSHEERARTVAQYRLHLLVEMHTQDATNTALNRKLNQKGGSRRG